MGGKRSSNTTLRNRKRCKQFRLLLGPAQVIGFWGDTRGGEREKRMTGEADDKMRAEEGSMTQSFQDKASQSTCEGGVMKNEQRKKAQVSWTKM